MKKFIFGLIAIVTLMLGVSMLSSCDNIGRNHSHISKRDSVQIAKMITDFQSPSFSDPEEFTTYAVDESRYQEFVSIVSKLEPVTISSIASNAIKNNKYVNYLNFVSEYNKNRAIYDTFDESTRRLASETDPKAIECYKKLEVPDTINI